MNSGKKIRYIGKAIVNHTKYGQLKPGDVFYADDNDHAHLISLDIFEDAEEDNVLLEMVMKPKKRIRMKEGE